MKSWYRNPHAFILIVLPLNVCFRIENADSLVNEKVDKGAYESVRGKLTAMSDKKPQPEHAKIMPGIGYV